MGPIREDNRRTGARGERLFAALFRRVGGLFHAQLRCAPLTIGRAGRREESDHHRASDQETHELELCPKMMGAQHIFFPIPPAQLSHDE